MKLGVCYYPEQWDRARWRDDAGRMATMGLKLVRIAEFAWARMEPREGQFDWEWLDEAVATLAEAGLEVVLGTPTAAPPRWLTERYPEVLAVDAQGRTRAAGSRRHVCLSSQKYFDASQAIVIAMAQRYGRHPAVVAWQTDNEYGCHDTLQSYSPQALTRFREWLRARYGSIEELNRRWGNVFWSMTCDGFEQIGLPVGLPAQANPIHALDWRRFASDEVLRFNRMQVDALREHAPGRPVLHNFMGFFGEFDHHAMGRDLDLASWDSYPPGAYRFDELHRSRRPPALGTQRPSRHRRVPPRPLSRHRTRPLRRDGAAGRTRELGALEPRPAAGAGSRLDLGGLRPPRGVRLLLPLAPAAVRAGADAFGTARQR